MKSFIVVLQELGEFGVYFQWTIFNIDSFFIYREIQAKNEIPKKKCLKGAKIPKFGREML